MKKLTVNNYAQFTLSDKVKTSGIILAVDSDVSYLDEETKLVCNIPKEDIIKVASCEPATKAQAAWLNPKPKKPVPVQEAKAAPVATPAPKVGKAKPAAGTPKAQPEAGGSKVDRAYALATQNPGHTKDQLVALFVEQLQMSPAGALTYYYNVQKRLRK